MADAGPPADSGASGGAGGAPPVFAFPPIIGTNNKDELINSLAVVAGFATVMMALRYFCKIRYAKGFGVDDGFLLLSWVRCFLFIVYLLLVLHWKHRRRSMDLRFPFLASMFNLHRSPVPQFPRFGSARGHILPVLVWVLSWKQRVVQHR